MFLVFLSILGKWTKDFTKKSEYYRKFFHKTLNLLKISPRNVVAYEKTFTPVIANSINKNGYISLREQDNKNTTRVIH